MRWIILGAGGMLGRDLVELLGASVDELVPLTHRDLDITSEASVRKVISNCDVVVNAAAYTDVDRAEEDEANAFAVNAVGPEILARRCSEIHARLVHVSTDYVFDGQSESPYCETALICPESAYGRTKAAGEWAVQANATDYLIVRTAWLYGRSGNCFPKTMVELAQKREFIDVVVDEIGQPTWSADLADLIIRLVRAHAPTGIYHGTASGATSWNGFGKQIMKSIGKNESMICDTTAAAFSRAAPRPHYSVLGHGALKEAGVAPIDAWDARWRIASRQVLGW
ncbi:MAG: dTDP-4-dehydrorhamnose reductase [Ancrocorticia sp.]|nr:dTDP-4-dehydrorhamnose reductase [Ancrocorticia sp.]MCI2194031.1 dTDP-4-dehydrorhamnose reductase [Ancrocorticia sp.]